MLDVPALARRVPLAISTVLGILLAACGGLESPDLATGAVAGRVDPAFPGARAYVLGQPEVRTELDAEGAFLLAPVPVGDAAVVVFDGSTRAGLRAARVRGAEVTWVGPAPAPLAGTDGAPGEPLPLPGASGALPLAGTIQARATASGAPVAGVRFTVEGTELVAVAPGAGGDAPLGPLPPGTFELVARAEGFAEARRTIEVRAGETVAVELGLEPATR
jgi:hypothetical protein